MLPINYQDIKIGKIEKGKLPMQYENLEPTSNNTLHIRYYNLKADIEAINGSFNNKLLNYAYLTININTNIGTC